MHHLTQDQVKSLLRAIPDPRMRTAMLVTYLHGLRISETLGLRVKDVAGGYLVVQRLKGSKKTAQQLFSAQDPEMDEAGQIEDLITRCRLEPEDRLFLYNRNWYNRALIEAGQKAGIPRHLCHPHVLKHSIAMRMVKKIGIEELMAYMGHKNLSSTGMYLRVTDAQASRAVLAALEENK